MLPLNKLLRIALPLGTATTAALITTILLSINRDDLDKKKENEDIQLNDFEDPVKEHKEEIISESTEKGAEPLEKPDKDAPENGEESSEGDPAEAPKLEITDLDEAVKNVVLEGVSSAGKIGQKGKGGVPKSDQGEKSPAVESKEQAAQAATDSGNEGPNNSATHEEDQELGDVGQLDGNPEPNVQPEKEVLSDSQANGKQESERGIENELIAKGAHEEEGSLSNSAPEAPESITKEPLSDLATSEGSEGQIQETASEYEDSSALESPAGKESVDQRQEKSKEIESRGENPVASDAEASSQGGIKDGNSDNYSEKAIKELEGYQFELEFLEGKLGDLTN